MMIMNKQDIGNAPKCAGIYCIKNNINGKCYIGQAIKLQKRLKAHLRNCNDPNYAHIAIYKAINKYGIENFELTILESFKDAFNENIKEKLDELEKKYIQEYDTYNHGYNSTLGGGVLGYKHTEEMKEHLRQVNLDREEEMSNWIKAKSLKTGEIIVSISKETMAQILKIDSVSIRNCINKKQFTIFHEWVLAKYYEDFPEIDPEAIPGKYNELLDKGKILEFIKLNPKCIYSDLPKEFKLCRKTFYNYKTELGLGGKQRVDTKVTKEEFLENYQKYTKDEFVKKYNISERRYYKYKEKYLRNT